jgi:hypothetical protein
MTAAKTLSVLNARDLRSGIRFNYGSHEYLVTRVSLADEIVYVEVQDHAYPLEFYPYSRIFTR